MGLPFLQNLQLLHLSLGFVDAGAHSLHHLQRLLHLGVVVVLPRGPFQQLLHMLRPQKGTKTIKTRETHFHMNAPKVFSKDIKSNLWQIWLLIIIYTT